MMNLYLSAAEHDYHTLLKVAEMAGLAGIIGFHEAGDGYLVTFPQGENVQALIDDYKGRLRDLENNIWQHSNRYINRKFQAIYIFVAAN